MADSLNTDISYLLEAIQSDEQERISTLISDISPTLVRYLQVQYKASLKDAEFSVRTALIDLTEHVREKGIRNEQVLYMYILRSIRNEYLKYHNKKTQDDSGNQTKGRSEEPLTLYRAQVTSPFPFWDLSTAAKRISEGLSTYILEVIRHDLQLSNAELAYVVSISQRTLARRKKEVRLPSDESERAYRVARLIEIAIDILGSKEEAQGWMREYNFALGNQKPLDLIRTEPGAQLVERILRQIEHGLTV